MSPAPDCQRLPNEPRQAPASRLPPSPAPSAQRPAPLSVRSGDVRPVLGRCRPTSCAPGRCSRCLFDQLVSRCLGADPGCTRARAAQTKGRTRDRYPHQRGSPADFARAHRGGAREDARDRSGGAAADIPRTDRRHSPALDTRDRLARHGGGLQATSGHAVAQPVPEHGDAAPGPQLRGVRRDGSAPGNGHELRAGAREEVDAAIAAWKKEREAEAARRGRHTSAPAPP